MKGWLENAERRNFVKGIAVAVGAVATEPIAVNWFENMEESLEAASSDVLSANARVYDQAAGMCGIDLALDITAGERVVIENELPVGNGRTVDNTGKRLLTTVVPADSTVLIYAVNLETKSSKTLKKYHITKECTLREESDG